MQQPIDRTGWEELAEISVYFNFHIPNSADGVDHIFVILLEEWGTIPVPLSGHHLLSIPSILARHIPVP